MNLSVSNPIVWIFLHRHNLQADGRNIQVRFNISRDSCRVEHIVSIYLEINPHHQPRECRN